MKERVSMLYKETKRAAIITMPTQLDDGARSSFGREIWGQQGEQTRILGRVEECSFV